MHMADALLSPGTGMAMWLVSGATLAFASRRVQERADDRLVPLMGMLGAFVFALQMLNFAIPGTGSHFVNSALNRDYTLVLGVVVFYAVLIMLLNLLVDLLYGMLDPKVKQG